MWLGSLGRARSVTVILCGVRSGMAAMVRLGGARWGLARSGSRGAARLVMVRRSMVWQSGHGGVLRG